MVRKVVDFVNEGEKGRNCYLLILMENEKCKMIF